MPVDKNGNRADVITDSTSTISRMNLGRAYEAYLGSLSRDTRQKIIQMYTNKYGANFLSSINEEDLLYFKDYIRELYSMINPDMTKFIDDLNQKELFNHLSEIVNDNLYFYYPTDNEYNITDVIEKLENSQYKPLNDKIVYKDELNQIVESIENIRIGQLYFMFLEKIGNNYSAVSSSKVNNFGFPVKGTNYDKFKYPHSLTPTKTLGETEVRILTSLCETEEGSLELIADIIDMTLNPISHKFLIKNILESKTPFNTNFNVDRSVVPYGNTKSLSILMHIFNAAGFTYNYSKD